MQNNTFPMSFTLERVDNGYILTSMDNGNSIADPIERKEVVIDDKINARIGQLLNLSTMKKELPIVFHIEAISESAYRQGKDAPTDFKTESLLAYYHYRSRKLTDGSVLILQIAESNTLEVYGEAAERAAANCNSLHLSRIGNAAVLKLENTKEGMKTLASCISKSSLLATSLKEIEKWYSEHKL